MNFSEYKVLDGDVNNYTKVILFVLPKIFVSSQNSMENDEINSMFTNLLSDYFEGLDGILPNKQKFDNEAKAKQFKKDMLNLKKSMVNFPGLETSWVKLKTENYNKLLIPETLITKKGKDKNKDKD